MRKLKQNSGITLVALVITIIVLLILAGITINLTVGQKGILTRAQEAGRNYTNAANYEDKQLADFLNEADRIIGDVTGEDTSKTPEKKLITFVVAMTTCTTEEGITWGEFIESDYNLSIREWAAKEEYRQNILNHYLEEKGINQDEWDGSLVLKDGYGNEFQTTKVVFTDGSDLGRVMEIEESSYRWL